MKMALDCEQVEVVEFGVGRDGNGGDEQIFSSVPVDAKVQSVLCEMVQTTWQCMQNEGTPTKYEPSDKYGSVEYLYLPLDDDMATALNELHQATNLSIDAGALNDLSKMFCYFARLTDKKKNKLTALRRASQFKGIVKKKGRLIRFLDDAMQIVEDNIFKLDNDFDLLIDDNNIHILHPGGFEFAGKLQQAILDAVPSNVASIAKELNFIEFTGIEKYAANHSRAARYLASIRAQKKMKNIDKSLLKKLCKDTGVSITESKGKVIIAEGDEMAFLQILDRRRYYLKLVPDTPETYVAASRKAIQ